jgi:hypothetical protein
MLTETQALLPFPGQAIRLPLFVNGNARLAAISDTASGRCWRCAFRPGPAQGVDARVPRQGSGNRSRSTDHILAV